VASVTALRQGLAARLATITGLRASAYFPELITPPMAVVGGPDIAYNDDTMSDAYTFPVVVIASESSDRAGQNTLDGWLASSGSSSVRQAVEDEDTLGGLAQYATVVGVRDYGIAEIQNTRYWAATVEVVAVVFR
jgi:hypothetical protein